MTYISEKLTKTKENNDLVEYTKYVFNFSKKKWEEKETYELRKIYMDEQEMLLENVLNDFLESENSTNAIEEIQEIMSKNWEVRVNDGGCGCESFYFKTKKEAMDFIRND